MFKRIIRFLLKAAMISILIIAAAMLLPRLVTSVFASSRLTTVDEVEVTEAALVFGAEVRANGVPSAALRNRVLAGIDLYQSGKVETLVMSGEVPEPVVMQALAVEVGVPEDAILLDEGGLRTYDTCYRAINVYGYEEAIVVTQDFHLPRSLYLCHFMGIDVQGVPAREGRYWRGSTLFWNVRESLATWLALWQIHITKPLPAITD
jgi:vancomycin permeability regulator SanA